MKVVFIASIGLAALSMLAPYASAQQTLQQRFPWMFHSQKAPSQKMSTTVTLVQTVQPVVRSYPGVAADILNIRTGMTVSQAEAIAEKNYPGKPLEYHGSDFLKYKEVTVQSHTVLQALLFVNQTADTTDGLSLYFGSPAIGNTLYAVTRDIKFGTNATFGYDPTNAPLMSTLAASLLKKYGPPSYRDVQPDLGFYVFAWTFSQKSAIPCESGECITGNGRFVLNPELSPMRSSGDPSDLTSINADTLSLPCTYTPPPIVFAIYARININPTDRTKADELEVSIWDSATCMDNGIEAQKQMKTAAIKLYNSVSKTPTAPKL